MPSGPLALVLSGGGARGAYEIGVLRYVLGELVPRLGERALPRLFCGTSVGAINACALAAHAADLGAGVRILEQRWSALELSHVFRRGWGDLAGLARWLIGFVHPDGPQSILDPAPLAELVRDGVPWRALRVGAGRVLVVGLRARRRPHAVRAGRQPEEDQRAISSPLFLFGKLLDALLLDRVENDLQTLRRINQAISAVPEFDRTPAVAALEAAGAMLRPVRDLFLHPSSDLGQLAADMISRPSVRDRLEGPAGWLLRRMGESAGATASPDMLSYLLFHGDYARELMALGESDARKIRPE